MSKPNNNTGWKKLRELLADIEHQRWADWQSYVHLQLINDYTIPVGLFQRWKKQIETSYKDLSEKEKDSDREQVDRYLPLIQKTLKERELGVIAEIEKDWDTRRVSLTLPDGMRVDGITVVPLAQIKNRIAQIKAKAKEL